MSPEYRVEIVVPYTYVVDAKGEDEAEKKAWELFEDGDEGTDPFGPAIVESVREIGAGATGNDHPDEGSVVVPKIAEVVADMRGRLDSFTLVEAFQRLTAEGRMPKVIVQVDDENGLVEAARLRVAGAEYFFHRTIDNAGRPIEVIRHRGETSEGENVSAYELPYDGWGMTAEPPGEEN